MRYREWVVLGSFLGGVTLLGCQSSPPPEVPRASNRAANQTEVSADALLSAWFGCAMGETWTAALETPPHTWAEPSLARCHAVGRVVDAPAPRLRVFVPEAVSAVSRSLENKLGAGSGYSSEERLRALELFSRGTLALEERAVAYDTAKEIARERAFLARAIGKNDVDLSEANDDPAAWAKRIRRISQADKLEALWSFAHSEADMRAAEARTLAFMSALQRVHQARDIPEDLRTIYVALALEAVADIERPRDFSDIEGSNESFGAYLARATAKLGDKSGPASEREAYATLKFQMAERLHALALPLSTSELRRAALGSANAFLREQEHEEALRRP